MKNQIVSDFIHSLNHPLELEIELLREIILTANTELTENIKWNAPNFCLNGEDRITMRIHPPKQVQLIFHRGAKVQTLPSENLIDDGSKLLKWKTTDRAVATFVNLADISTKTINIKDVVNKWILAAK